MNPLLRLRGATIALILLAIFGIGGVVRDVSTQTSESGAATAVAGTSAVSIQHIQDTLAAHPAVGSVRVHAAEPHNATAVLLLQRHISPGTKPKDAVNDRAVTTQKELVGIVGNLHAQTGISTFLVEGKTHDPASATLAEELSALRGKVANRESLREIIGKLKNRDDVPANLRSMLAKHEDAFFAQEERALLLRGAPEAAYAHGTDLTLQGAETPETYKKSAKIVVEYMQITNRLKYLSGPKRSTAGLETGKLEPAKLIDVSALRTMLQSRGKRDASAALSKTLNDIKSHSRQAENDDDIQRAVNLLREITKTATTSKAPVRATPAGKTQNPYAKEVDRNALKRRLDEVKAAMKETVVDQRNADTAENFVTYLQGTGAQVGAIQFGAQHRDGLVDELLARGVSVVVVTPVSLQE